MHHTDSIEDNADFYYDRACGLIEENPVLALKHLQTALEYEPHHLQALVEAGELHLFHSEPLGLTDEAAVAIALEYIERALAHEPRYAEAWSDKAIALFYQEKDEAAIAAAEQGLVVLPLKVDFGMEWPAVFTNVAEALHNIKVKALLELGRCEQARQALTAGLSQCPGSALLTRRIEAVLENLEF